MPTGSRNSPPLLTAAAIVVLPSPGFFLLTAEQNERMYQRAAANDRAGHYQYPGTVSRQLRELSTPESRRASYERYLAQMAEWRAGQPTPWQRLRRSGVPVLAALFGIIVWNLAGVVRPTVLRALVWWGVAWFAMLAMDGPGEQEIKRSEEFRIPELLISLSLVKASASVCTRAWPARRTSRPLP